MATTDRMAGRDARTECERCAVALEGSAYEVRTAVETAYRCLKCALLHPPTVMRSLLIALVVGTLLTAINQGNLIVQGDLSAALAWKVPLTYAVPYCVATTGAILNARRSLGGGQPSISA